MKVFDLHCPLDHVFEGWFASEEDFRSQLDRGLVECPMCGSKELRKGLSAPRLNLGAQPAAAAPAPVPDEADRRKLHALQAAWLEVSRKIAAKTEDVGERFAEEALRMHKGEEPERPIRGQATPQQAMELLEEGVPVMPLALPKSSKETLQ
ncbi:hypothetical protein B5M06_01650 [Comamonas kerstersii]|jgi:hypothetical protein|uniref:DUF1178 family protein n=1 Tax=Comamonas kerstersii TaxID=225992 RepID=A0A1V0BB42_9BURK|nr:DUF1178 family protein [Comamonas kerstersii]AQZ97156.1 hypothetical protein B5M06_01650 [Comamonas kerstersii]